MRVVLKTGTGVVKHIESVKEAVREFSGELLIVPGGWKFSDAVREAQRELGFSDEAAHWAAIMAMDQLGLILSELLDLPTTEDLRVEGKAVLLPYRVLREMDPLPHSWDVTSDAIAAWVAAQIGADRVVYAKDVPGILDERGRVIEEVPAGELVDRWTAIDPWAPRIALKSGLELRVVDASSPVDLLRALEGAEFRGTRVPPVGRRVRRDRRGGGDDGRRRVHG